MIEESGEVVALAGDDSVWIETQRHSTCSACQAQRHCGTATLAKVLGRRRMRIRLRNSVDARVGDRVVLGVAETALLRASLLMYLLPVALMLGLAVACQLAFGGGDATTALAGGAGMGLGLLWARWYARRQYHDPRWAPVLLRRTPA